MIGMPMVILLEKESGDGVDRRLSDLKFSNYSTFTQLIMPRLKTTDYQLTLL